MEPLGSVAGMAASIYGASFFVVGSVIGSFIDRQLVNSVTPMAIGYFIAGLLTVALVYAGQASPVTKLAASEIGD
jgi:MFS transporter, DHA1 family, multidrug resistance protein